MDRTVKESREIDRSNGWEAAAREFIAECRRSTIGVEVVGAWARSLPRGATLLDLGCGPGGLRSEVLIELGFSVHAVDASPTLAEAYQDRFSGARVACEAVEESRFFDRTFDAALAWGVLFLLPADVQRSVIRRVANALDSGGRFLFTAPTQVCTWADLTTNRVSVSLGADAYKSALAAAGLTLVAEYDDEGENHYYDAVKHGSF